VSGPIRRRVVIDDVARVAGVSRQTVSNVLNEHGRFTDVTRQRVLTAVADLGYQPHHAARSMRSHRTATLAHPVVASELLPHNLFAAQFLQALVAATGAAGYSLLTTPAGPTDPTGQFVAEGRVDGVILCDSGPEDPRVARLAANGTPFASFGRTGPGQPQCWVDVDSTGSVRAATDHVLLLGHRRIAFLGYAGSASGVWDDDRVRGFETAMTAAGVCPTGVERVEHDDASAAVDRLLGAEPRPSAIVCGSDVLAAAVYGAADAHGLRIGRDLAVTGFDGGGVLASLSPTLTTLRQPLDVIARHLVERVSLEVDGLGGGPGVLLTAPLVVGESTVPRGIPVPFLRADVLPGRRQ